MESTVTIDLRQVARGLDASLRQVQAAVELLDEGNTVPFITRYRKDHTGGLDEEQVREIQDRLAKMRLLADRKQTILRSIESQGKLTEKLAKQILAATTAKRLEDLYLPFKPKKQTLATLARSRGLEPLAREIFEAAATCADLDARAADFVSEDRQVPTAADALLGAGHIIAEHISERAELRQELRELLQRTGVIVSTRLAGEEKPQVEMKPVAEKARATSETVEPTSPEASEIETSVAATVALETATESVHAKSITAEGAVAGDVPPPNYTVFEMPVASSEVAATWVESPAVGELASSDVDPSHSHTAEPLSSIATDIASADIIPPQLFPLPPQPPTAAQRKATRQQAKLAVQKKKEEKKKKLEEKKIKAFRDYFEYSEAIKKMPPHRVLAINRGERARVLRVRIESDLQAMFNMLEEALVSPTHPHLEYIRGCARDALSRLILPSLEREIRRELTDHAETHAVGVFARNLRNLLLQPPVHNHRLLAVDPGFRSGCKLAALDEFGNLLDHGVIFLVGKPDRSDEARKTVLEWIEKHQLTVIVIGNGTACRHTEDFFAKLLENELKDRGVAYVIVNEAGASVYSTSRVGREEFPEYDATLRGAISIGRRLQDPLSELVKIEPANIGVGLYQHDVKAKHLQTSLDGVVESCVNFVGVDANTASPALFRYVSGLNQLTARRLYEYRREHGPFRSREQLHDVPGFGEATYVQAAGFLKILGGDNPLDSTWIHPESYAAANRALEHLHATVADLSNKETAATLAERIAQIDLEALAKELEVGVLTLKDILAQLARPGRDPREDLPAPVFKSGIINLEDLAPNMELTGTVLNVVDFGCFVDIGMHDSGLVHVSRLADKFVRDPHDVVAVGDIVKVWVTEIDKERRRVSLTMIRPGSERAKTPFHGGRPSHERPAGEGATSDGQPHEGRRRDGHRPPRREGQPQQGGQHDAHQRPPRPAGQPGGSQQGGHQGGHDRPPRPAGDRRPQDRRPQGGRPQGGRPPREEHRMPPRPRPAPKPLIPITDAMKVGKEPMRTFGDLMQFYQHKEVAPTDGKPKAAMPIPVAAAPEAAESRDAKSETPVESVVAQTDVAEAVAVETPTTPPADG